MRQTTTCFSVCTKYASRGLRWGDLLGSWPAQCSHPKSPSNTVNKETISNKQWTTIKTTSKFSTWYSYPNLPRQTVCWQTHPNQIYQAHQAQTCDNNILKKHAQALNKKLSILPSCGIYVYSKIQNMCSAQTYVNINKWQHSERKTPVFKLLKTANGVDDTHPQTQQT